MYIAAFLIRRDNGGTDQTQLAVDRVAALVDLGADLVVVVGLFDDAFVEVC